MSDEQQEMEASAARAALAVPESKPLAPGAWGTGAGSPWLGEYERMAMAVSRAIVLPAGIRKAGDASTPEGRAAIAATALAVALAGREYGLGFMAATRLIHVIDGQTAPAAQLMVARARAGGHVIAPVARTGAMCRVTCESCALPQAQQVEWALTADDAESSWAVIASEVMIEQWHGPSGQREKIAVPMTTKGNWQSYGRQMLFWRAAVELIRMHCPEATMGMYALEELGGSVDGAA